MPSPKSITINIKLVSVANTDVLKTEQLLGEPSVIVVNLLGADAHIQYKDSQNATQVINLSEMKECQSFVEKALVAFSNLPGIISNVIACLISANIGVFQQYEMNFDVIIYWHSPKEVNQQELEIAMAYGISILKGEGGITYPSRGGVSFQQAAANSDAARALITMTSVLNKGLKGEYTINQLAVNVTSTPSKKFLCID